MKTIIENLKQTNPDATTIEDLEDEIESLEHDIRDKDNEIQELQDQIKEMRSSGKKNTYKTALGKIIVINESGNLQLQQELNDFFELIQQKYL